jgi:hypothetical protein
MTDTGSCWQKHPGIETPRRWRGYPYRATAPAGERCEVSDGGSPQSCAIDEAATKPRSGAGLLAVIHPPRCDSELGLPVRRCATCLEQSRRQSTACVFAEAFPAGRLPGRPTRPLQLFPSIVAAILRLRPQCLAGHRLTSRRLREVWRGGADMQRDNVKKPLRMQGLLQSN